MVQPKLRSASRKNDFSAHKSPGLRSGAEEGGRGNDPFCLSSVPCSFSDANTALFNEDNLKKLKEAMSFHKVPAGSHLFWEGDPIERFYYVQCGQVKVYKSTNEGKELTLYMFHSGDMFGEPRSVEACKYKFHAKVTKDSVIGFIEHRDLEGLLFQQGDLAVQFMKWMGVLHCITQTKLRDLMLYGKSGALSSTLIRMSNTYGEEVENGIRINQRMSNTELANIIGTARENVNRILNKWKHLDVIAIDHGHIIIQNIEFLKQICHCQDCPKEICRM